MPERLAVLCGVRTPFARAGTDLQDVDAADLGARVFAEALARSGVDPGELDEVVLGCAGQPIEAQNLARVAALRAGVPESVPAVTVHRNCASGMEAVTQAMLRIRAGEASLLLVGGVEAMTRAPVVFPDAMRIWLMGMMKARKLPARLRALARFRPRLLKPQSSIVMGLRDPVSGLIMGDTAEVLAREFSITRGEQDAYALESHQKSERAWQEGRLREEVMPLALGPRYRKWLDADNGFRTGLTVEKLARLRPYFDRRHGSVTVGNSCQLTDGGVALLVASEQRAKELGLQPLGFVREFAYAGLDPRRMGLGPVHATRRLLQRTGGRLDDFDLIELNEAFAAQVLACCKAAASARFAKREWQGEPLGEILPEKLNVNGGAIALGHPVGATGTRLVLTLLQEMQRRQVERGLATLCIGGGQGAALDLEAA